MIEVTNCDLKMKHNDAILLRMPKRHSASAFAVESRILFLRQQRVILDADLAELYGVPVKVLNQQVKRNRERFPADFVFQLTSKEHEILRSQIVTSRDTHMVAAATHPMHSPSTGQSWLQPCSIPSALSR